ncbi:glycosyltransferase family 2 protein [Aeoliella sp. ICT_H6.2]|uniref:Glycosyltransferase family 2 protein n=1 Tax=Aeoliella straminimaris TaxID=2954799 RepID=A0A9X2FCQ7_9BACT|nr:glycosyltransferase family 2 protein [Aeoliella straminimaris]MCO6046565.1 glycosyltransferase family 2 protein [Aeoliella straminimaris]
MTPITIVIPAFDEAASLSELHRQLREVAAAHDYRLRMVVVDDGSTDNTWQVVEQLAAEDDHVLGIRFRRNFGKAAALTAGFDVAEDPYVVTMDADLQDDPAELPLLLKKLSEGYDVVSGWKVDRKDPWHKTLPSKVFNKLVGWLTGVKLHDHNCGFKLYRREVFDEVRIYGELHRFVPVLAAARGFKVGEVPVNHRPREFGHSKYGVMRIVKGLLDLFTVKFITGFGQRPQHLLGATGLVAFLFGFVLLCYLAVMWCVSRISPSIDPVHLHETAALYYALASFLIGGQFLSVGLLGEMITAFLIRKADMYSVSAYTGPEERVPRTGGPQTPPVPPAQETHDH